MLTYEQIISELFERHQSVQTAGFTADSYKPGLERMERLDSEMGRPSESLRTIHVAGTNGKGSVSSMLAASLSGDSRRIGLFTSPHLLDFRERIKIVSEEGYSMIPKEAVVEFTQSFNLEGLSFFEVTTGMALWYFARENVDLAVMEVGLGGLLDSTNIIVPEISIVTSIGLDHCALLGSTRAEIATQKAGIFKPGVPALVGEWDEETAPVFESTAAAVHCPLFFADNWDEPQTDGIDLKGGYQAKNLRTALAAMDILGVEPDSDLLRSAGRLTGFDGRWQTLASAPLTIADIGHNPPAMEENLSQLREMMASGKYDKLTVVYGAMADKDVDGILAMMPQEAEFVFTAPSTPRAMAAEEIARRFALTGKDAKVTIAGSVPEAVALARAASTPQSLVFVGGSAFVVADYLASIL